MCVCVCVCVWLILFNSLIMFAYVLILEEIVYLVEQGTKDEQLFIGYFNHSPADSTQYSTVRALASCKVWGE